MGTVKGFIQNVRIGTNIRLTKVKSKGVEDHKKKSSKKCEPFQWFREDTLRKLFQEPIIPAATPSLKEENPTDTTPPDPESPNIFPNQLKMLGYEQTFAEIRAKHCSNSQTKVRSKGVYTRSQKKK